MISAKTPCDFVVVKEGKGGRLVFAGCGEGGRVVEPSRFLDARKFSEELDETARIGPLQENEKLFLRCDPSERTGRCGIGRRVLIPGKGCFPESLRVEISDKHLMGRIGDGFIETPQPGFKGRKERSILPDDPTRFRPVPNE